MADFPAADEIVSAAEVAAGLKRLAASLQPIIAQQSCTLLTVMTGGIYPLMQLASRLHGDFLLDYCHATRYAGGTVGGQLEWLQYPRLPMAGRTIVIVDDILDVGLTLEGIRSYCQEQGAGQVYTAVLAVKDIPGAEQRREPDFSTGIRLPNRYVFGCGMDLHESWRHLDAIYALPEALD